jgi:hypothetical protein
MDDPGRLLNIFLDNILRFDIIIFIAAVINFWVFIRVRRESANLYKKMHLTIFVPSHVAFDKDTERIFDISEPDVIAMRKRCGILYNIYTTLTGIFNLLGILGTVISLIPMVDQMDVVKLNFFVALTSTFWGLVFAILFKSLDASISGKIEDNEKTVALYLERNAMYPAVKK